MDSKPMINPLKDFYPLKSFFSTSPPLKSKFFLLMLFVLCLLYLLLMLILSGFLYVSNNKEIVMSSYSILNSFFGTSSNVQKMLVPAFTSYLLLTMIFNSIAPSLLGCLLININIATLIHYFVGNLLKLSKYYQFKYSLLLFFNLGWFFGVLVNMNPYEGSMVQYSLLDTIMKGLSLFFYIMLMSALLT